MGRGFQAVQRGVASGSERPMASLATERLDVLGLAVLAIADERMNVRISDPEVCTLWVGTSEALCVHALGCSPPALDLTPGTYRTRIWPRPHRGSGSEATEGAIIWGAWLEQTVHRGAHCFCFEMGRLESEPAITPKQSQRIDEEEHEQEHVDLRGHRDPHCLKWGAWSAPVSSKDKQSREPCQAIGRD